MTDEKRVVADDDLFQQGHRNRLRQKFLNGQLSHDDMFELLLSYPIPRRDVRPLARRLMATYGGIHQVLSAPIESLVQNNGVKINTAIFLKVIQQIMLMDYREHLERQEVFRDVTNLTNYCRTQLMGKKIEEFHVLYLSDTYKLLADDLHSSGTIDFAQVYPREIVHRALNLKAQAVVLVHNHPTPDMPFSTQDIAITMEIMNMLQTMKLELFDHFLVAGSTVYSARNLHLI